MKKVLVTLILALASSVSAFAFDLDKYNDKDRYFIVNYTNYSFFYDCFNKAPVMYEMYLSQDNSNVKRVDNFDYDPMTKRRCQQKSVGTYKSRKKIKYHRGHLVSANSQDTSRRAMNETFYMTNIMPQVGKFNTGAWYYTEMVEQCLRDKYNSIKILGGVVFDSSENDIFVRSHGIKTPDKFWKVIITPEGYYAWIFPNSEKATKSKAARYMVRIGDIESLIGLPLSLQSGAVALSKSSLPNTSKCNLS